MEMYLALVFGLLALIFLIWNIITSINIVSILKENDIKADLRWLRFKAFGYAKKYKNLTIEKYGKVGNLYFSFMTSSVLFSIVLAIGIMIVYLEN